MSGEKRPEWVPQNAGSAFASWVRSGVSEVANQEETTPRVSHPRRKELSLHDFLTGFEAGDRGILARAITLVESNHPRHLELAQQLIQHLLPRTGDSIRVGITGTPGAGKSTFIDALGTFLCENGHQVAVLAVDPSSSRSRGSILGDKTRMERLSRNPSAFIRPSPSGGMLGGVARKSRETILLCEAFGFDVLLVETVGVGQSEITVRSMVDFFLLLTLTGAGDELQGIKRGVMEIADLVLVNKADAENKPKAEQAAAEMNRVLHFLSPSTPGWTTRSFPCSALSGEGISHAWQVVQRFVSCTREGGTFQERRQKQRLEWVNATIVELLKMDFFNHPGVRESFPGIQEKVMQGSLSPSQAVKELLGVYAK